MTNTNQTPEAALPSKKEKSWAVGLTNEMVAKQEAFFNVRVKHPAMQRLLDDMMPLLMPHSESNLIVVTGPTGAGKSTVTRVLLKELFQDFAQLMQDDKSVVPLIAVEAYANGDTRHSFKEIYTSMRQQLLETGVDQTAPTVMSEGKLKVKPMARNTVGALRFAVEEGLKKRRTRVGVIDEAAHLLRFDKKAVVMDTLKSLANTTGTKWVLVGSYDLFDLVLENGQVARRTTILNLGRYHIDQEEDRNEFAEIIRKLMKKWPSEEKPNFVAISDALLEASLGCVGLLKSLLLDASAMQLRAGGKWNPEFLRKAAKASKIREVIQAEIRAGEEKVRDAIHGNSIWDDKMFAGLVHTMETASV